MKTSRRASPGRREKVAIQKRSYLPPAPLGKALEATSVALLALLLCTPGAAGADSTPTAAEVQRRMLSRLDGRHFTAEVTLRIHDAYREEQRRLRVWRDDREGRGERLMAHFEEPADMRGLGLLYLENLDAPNDYFLYQPVQKRVRRIPESLAREDAYGVDLEYLGFGGAQLTPADAVSVEEVALDGHRVLRLTERARRDNPRFDQRVIWLEPETFVPLRTEHRKNDHILLVAATVRLETVGGVPTPLQVRFDRPEQGEVVEMRVRRIDYEEAIPEIFFSTLQLIKRR